LVWSVTSDNEKNGLRKKEKKMRSAKKRQQRFFAGIEEPVEPYASAMDRASENDREWFVEHPQETYRVRPYIAGEFRDVVPPTNCRVLVEQIEEGYRARSVIGPEIVKWIAMGGTFFTPLVQELRHALVEVQKTRVVEAK